MDTVIGRPGGPVLVPMAERVNRYTLIATAASRDATEVGAEAYLAHPSRSWERGLNKNTNGLGVLPGN